MALIGAEALVFSIRPPRPGIENWAVNFRVAERETAWNCGPPMATAEEAIMDALQKIEAILANRNASHVSIGRTTFLGPGRFVSIDDGQRNHIRGEGDTVTQAADDALARLEKQYTKKPKAAIAVVAEDPLDDLLG